MKCNRSEGEPKSLTLGNALAAQVNLIVRCKSCGRTTEPDVADQVGRYGAELPVPELAARLTVSACGGRQVDFVVSGV